MQIVKIAVEAGPDVDALRAIQEVQFLCGGLVKVGEGGQFVHYLEAIHAGRAETEWQRRGYTVVSSEEVELGPEGITGLLANLDIE